MTTPQPEHPHQQRRFANPNLVSIILAALFVLVLFAEPLGADVPRKEWLLFLLAGGIVGDIAAPLVKRVIGGAQ